MGRIWAVATIVVVLVAGVPDSAGAQAKPPSPKQMEAAKKKANAAAARLAKARGALIKAEAEVADLQARTSETKAVVERLEGQVRDLAVRQYVQGGRPDSWVGAGDPDEAARGRAMARYVSLGRADAVEGYRVARIDLEENTSALTERIGEQKAVVGRLKKEEAAVSAELRKLATAQKAYEQRIAAERAAAARRAGTRRASRSDPGPVSGVTGVIASGPWVCPVQGPRAFSNDYGDPRSGGRRHQGNDMMSPRGTPVVAPVSGTVRGHNSSLGGISFYLAGEDGNTYFGTHLSRLSGASGRVEAGTVVGYVGSSGNASESSPHLHFEIHPGGGRPVNPYSTLSRYC